MAEPEPVEHNNPQVVYSWKAPLRPYVKRSMNVLRFYFAVALLISLIVFFLGDRILIIPIGTLLFLFYVLTVTPPQEVEHKITKFGIEAAGGITFRYEDLSHFYFHKRFEYDVLTTVTHEPYYYHCYMVIPNEEIKKKVIEILASHLVYQEKPVKNIVDKMIDWLSALVVEDEPHPKATFAGATGQTPEGASPLHQTHGPTQ